MKDILKVIVFMLILLICAFSTTDIITNITKKKDDEYIKILEQSLNEQIQEKKVYMKMLQESEE